jgi:hypothetical protein
MGKKKARREGAGAKKTSAPEKKEKVASAPDSHRFSPSV